MSRKSIVPLLPNDLQHNYVELLVWKRLLKDDTATAMQIESVEPGIIRHIAKFTITTELLPVVSVEVGKGKYKTAMLLLYLAHKQKSSSFRMNDECRSIVMQYFTVEVITDALSNPDTAHTSVRALLSSGPVLVNCLA